MKLTRKAIMLALGLLFISQAIQAQIPGLPKGASSIANAGTLISQLTNAIKPASFTDAWSGSKSGFLGQASKISNAVSMASTISSLAGFIKPAMFKEGSSASTIMSTANKVKTMADAAGLLKSFEGGLKPEALLSSWSGQRTGWLSALNLLK